MKKWWLFVGVSTHDLIKVEVGFLHFPCAGNLLYI